MDKYRSIIQQGIKSFPKKGKVLFGFLIAERLYPNYLWFEKKEKWGNHIILANGFITVYEYLAENLIIDDLEIQNLIEQIDIVTPDTDDFSHITVSFALDACTAIRGVLSYLLNGIEEEIVDVAIFARDTVDMFVQEKYDLQLSDPNFEFLIAEDPLMKKEKNKQLDIIRKIELLNLDDLNSKIIETMRTKDPIIELEIFE